MEAILSPNLIEQCQKLTQRRPVQDVPASQMFGAFIELANKKINSLLEANEIDDFERFLEGQYPGNQAKSTLRRSKSLIGSVSVDTENHHGRHPGIDNHAEQQSSTGSTHQTTSAAALGQGNFWKRTMDQTEGNNILMKLILSTRPSMPLKLPAHALTT